MYYEINVSKFIPAKWGVPDRYVHYFATAERSLTCEADARTLFDDLRAKYPSPEFQVHITLWRKQGERLEW